MQEWLRRLERRLPGSLCELAGLRRARGLLWRPVAGSRRAPVAGAGGRGDLTGLGFPGTARPFGVAQLPRHWPPALFAEYIRPRSANFLESDSDAAPFSRQQRSLVYQRARATPTSGPSAPRRMSSTRATGGSITRWCPAASESQDFRVTIGANRPSPIRPASSTSLR